MAPVFIVGPHRSGTTLLYSLLGRSGAFNVVTAYHVLRADRLLADHRAGRVAEAKAELAAEFRRQGLSDRVIDGVPVGPDTPEEYGFVLSGRPRPRYGPATRERFDAFCDAVRAVSDPGRPLLLKNPWDTESVPALKRDHPDARFVFLHRHPLRTIDSQIRAIRSLFAERNAYAAMTAPWYAELHERPWRLRAARALFAERFGLAFRIVLRTVERAANAYLDDAPRLPAADRVSVGYESLCAAPDAAVAAVLDHLGLDSRAPLGLAGEIAPRSRPLLPEVERRRPVVERRLRRYLEDRDYTRATTARAAVGRARS